MYLFIYTYMLYIYIYIYIVIYKCITIYVYTCIVYKASLAANGSGRGPAGRLGRRPRRAPAPLPRLLSTDLNV